MLVLRAGSVLTIWKNAWLAVVGCAVSAGVAWLAVTGYAAGAGLARRFCAHGLEDTGFAITGCAVGAGPARRLLRTPSLSCVAQSCQLCCFRPLQWW